MTVGAFAPQQEKRWSGSIVEVIFDRQTLEFNGAAC
jgi:hypothetical protein